MKTLDKINFSSKEILKNEELIALKGGISGTSFTCKNGGQVTGCVTLSNCDLETAEDFCEREFGAYDQISYSCGNAWEGCYEP